MSSVMLIDVKYRQTKVEIDQCYSQFAKLQCFFKENSQPFTEFRLSGVSQTLLQMSYAAFCNKQRTDGNFA